MRRRESTWHLHAGFGAMRLAAPTSVRLSSAGFLRHRATKDQHLGTRLTGRRVPSVMNMRSRRNALGLFCFYANCLRLSLPQSKRRLDYIGWLAHKSPSGGTLLSPDTQPWPDCVRLARRATSQMHILVLYSSSQRAFFGRTTQLLNS